MIKYGKVRPYNVVRVDRKPQPNAGTMIQLAEQIGAKIQTSRNGQKVTITFSDLSKINTSNSKPKFRSIGSLRNISSEQKTSTKNLENIRLYSSVILK